MQIRKERQEEFEQIYQLVQEAFTTAQVSDGTEQDFVEELRRRGGYLPEFALVAEQDGGLVGHIMLTKTKWIDAKGEEENALLLAPLCVKEGYRSQGIGGKLIAEACRRAADAGYSAVFLIGNPDYYMLWLCMYRGIRHLAHPCPFALAQLHGKRAEKRRPARKRGKPGIDRIAALMVWANKKEAKSRFFCVLKEMRWYPRQSCCAPPWPRWRARPLCRRDMPRHMPLRLARVFGPIARR